MSDLYQTKALMVDLDNEDSRKFYMDLTSELFEKRFQKTAKLTMFVERSYASFLTRSDRCEEAIGHFYNVIEGTENKSIVSFKNVHKLLVDVHIRREIEALGGCVNIPLKILAAYELILTLMKLKQIEETEKVASSLERLVEEYSLSLPVNKLVTHSIAGYAYMIIGNKEKAAEIFVSVLEKNPGHPPVTEALKSCGM